MAYLQTTPAIKTYGMLLELKTNNYTTSKKKTEPTYQQKENWTNSPTIRQLIQLNNNKKKT